MSRKNRNAFQIKPNNQNTEPMEEIVVLTEETDENKEGSETIETVVTEVTKVGENELLVDIDTQPFVDPSIIVADLSYIPNPEVPVVKEESITEEVVDNVLNYTDGKEIRRRGAVDRLERMARVFKK